MNWRQGPGLWIKTLLPSCGQQPAEPWRTWERGEARDGSHCRFPPSQDTDGRPHRLQVFSLQKQNSFLWNDTESEVQMAPCVPLFLPALA